jgi:hypothetical protein
MAGEVLETVVEQSPPALAVSGRGHAELQTAAHAIRDHHRQVEESLRQGFSNALVHAIEAGRKLIFAKALVGHGGWGSWVERNLTGFDVRTERLYRQLAEAADDGRLQIGHGVATLSIRKARELLAQAASADELAAAAGDQAERRLTTVGQHDVAEHRSRTPFTSRLAKQVLAPLRAALVEDSEIDYQQIVGSLADELEPSEHAQEWASVLEELFANVGDELKQRSY